MEPDIWPLDPQAVTALVTRTIAAIDGSTEEERDDLLGKLLCDTWGSILAQDQ
jgi:hypothetical protein